MVPVCLERDREGDTADERNASATRGRHHRLSGASLCGGEARAARRFPHDKPSHRFSSLLRERYVGRDAGGASRKRCAGRSPVATPASTAGKSAVAFPRAEPLRCGAMLTLASTTERGPFLAFMSMVRLGRTQRWRPQIINRAWRDELSQSYGSPSNKGLKDVAPCLSAAKKRSEVTVPDGGSSYAIRLENTAQLHGDSCTAVTLEFAKGTCPGRNLPRR